LVFVRNAELFGRFGEVTLLVVGHGQLGPKTAVTGGLGQSGAKLRDGFVKAAEGNEPQAQVRMGRSRVWTKPQELLVLAHREGRFPVLLRVERILEELFRVRLLRKGGAGMSQDEYGCHLGKPR
jgi:hypothetical protein